MKIAYIIFYLSVVSLMGCTDEGKPIEDNNESPKKDKELRLPEILSITEAIHKNPADPNLFYRRSHAYANKGLFEAAIEDMYKAIELDSLNSNYHLFLSDLHYTIDDIVGSIIVLEKNLRTHENDITTMLRLSRLYMYTGEHPKSIIMADDVLMLDIYNAEAYFVKGMVFKEVGDTSKAISNFQTSTEQDPKKDESYVQLGLLFSVQNNPIALDYFKNALSLRPESEEAKYGIALFYQNNNQITEAIQEYKKLIAQNPQNELAYYNVGYIYFQQDSVHKAESNFIMATNVAPDYADAYYMLGLCAEIRGEKEDARYYFRQTLNMDGQHELAILGIERISN